jgi:hypothetical protein
VKLVAHNRPQLLCMQPLGKPERSQHFTHQTNIAAAQPASAIHTHHTSTVHSRPVPSSVIPISRVRQHYLPSHPPNHRPERNIYSCVLVCGVQHCVRGSDSRQLAGRLQHPSCWVGAQTETERPCRQQAAAAVLVVHSSAHARQPSPSCTLHSNHPHTAVSKPHTQSPGHITPCRPPTCSLRLSAGHLLTNKAEHRSTTL